MPLSLSSENGKVGHFSRSLQQNRKKAHFLICLGLERLLWVRLASINLMNSSQNYKCLVGRIYDGNDHVTDYDDMTTKKERALLTEITRFFAIFVE